MFSVKTKVAATLAATAISVMSLVGCSTTDDGGTDSDNSGVAVVDTIRGGIMTRNMITPGSKFLIVEDAVVTLDGLVFVDSGATLTIEPGVVLKGKSGEGNSASALIIAKDGKIDAVGTVAKPIIMTSTSDNLGTPLNANGLWGGLIVLGNAPINTKAGTETNQIEGIDPTESRGQYGGIVENDNSGVIKYVSVRYGGTNIGDGNEINGLTLGGVGSATEISFVEVFNNKDDGIEFFGGSVSIENAVVYGCADDSYDWDEGYRGKENKNWIAIHSSDNTGDKLAEMDGTPSGNGSARYSFPKISNATFIGSESGSGMKFREETAGIYTNSIFVNVSEVKLDDEKGGKICATHFASNEWSLTGNVFENESASSLMKYGFAAGQSDNGDAITTSVESGNSFGVVTGVSASNLVPSDNSKGACTSGDWTTGWTAYSQM